MFCKMGAHPVTPTIFDIDWEPLKPQLRNKVLIPVLGNQYGEELEMGQHPSLGSSEGQFSVGSALTRVFPIDPQTIPLIFEPLEVSLAYAPVLSRS